MNVVPFKDIPDQFKLAADLPSKTRTPFRLCVAAGGMATLLALIGFWRLQPIIPLFYSLADPNQQLVSKWWLGLFPGLSILFTLFHFILVRKLKDWTEVIVLLIAWTCVVLQIVLLLIEIRLGLILW